MKRERSTVIALLAVIMLVLVYLPILAGRPLGWTLYAYWSLLGLVSLVVAWILEWGDIGG